MVADPSIDLVRAHRFGAGLACLDDIMLNRTWLGSVD